MLPVIDEGSFLSQPQVGQYQYYLRNTDDKCLCYRRMCVDISVFDEWELFGNPDKNDVVVLDRATIAGVPNLNKQVYSKEEFNRAIQCDRIKELIKSGSFSVEIPRVKFANRLHEVYTTDPQYVCAKVLVICDDVVIIQILDREKYNTIKDPVVAFDLLGIIEDNDTETGISQITNIQFIKCILQERKMVYSR